MTLGQRKSASYVFHEIFISPYMAKAKDKLNSCFDFGFLFTANLSPRGEMANGELRGDRVRVLVVDGEDRTIRNFRSTRSSTNNQTCFLLGAIKKWLEACELLGLGSSQARSKPNSPRDKAEPELRDGARVSRPYVSGTQVRFNTGFPSGSATRSSSAR